MDSRPKRRVLSLSLSQPSKPNNKLKLKRHISTSSKNDKNISANEDSLPISSIRDDVKIHTPVSSSISSKPTDVHTVDAFVFDRGGSSSPTSPAVITGLGRKGSEKQTADEPGGHFKEGVASARSSAEEAGVHKLKRSATEVQGESNGASTNKEEPILDNHLCRRKVIEKIPLKDQSLNCCAVVPEDNLGALIEKRIGESQKFLKESETVSSSRISSNCDVAQTKLLEEKITLPNQSSEFLSVIQPSVDALVMSKMYDKNSTSETIMTNTNEEWLDILPCPLCSKNFDKSASKTSHLKSCASKNKVSTQQLLEILELQRRQAAERKALGLPGILQVTEKSKKPPSKKENRINSKTDSNLQLAMALSLSLQDQEQSIGSSRSSEPAKAVSLNHFGFTNKSVLESVQPRPSIAPIPRGKAKGIKKSTPILLTRTAEERQQIITEKVAMVLLEELDSETNTNLQVVNVKSSFLQDCLDKETALWAKSHTSPSKTDRTSFYVQDLRGFISPSKVEMGSKILHVSQVAGRIKTPTKVQEQRDHETASPFDEDISSDSSYRQPNELKDPSHIEMELRAKLFNDWASMVNNSPMSDLAIYPQEGRDIPAHKIVLHVRCPRILQDICRQRNPLTGNEVEVIMWSKTPHAAALAFLEYVYCGSVKSIRVLSEDLSSILWLARHYKVADLIRYLSAVSESNQTSEISSQVALNIIEDMNEQVAEPKNCQDESKNCNEMGKEREAPILKEIGDLCSRRQSKPFIDTFAPPVVTQSDTESIYSEVTLPENYGSCSSPDMFCDDDIDESPEILQEVGHPVCSAERSKQHNPSDYQNKDCLPSRSDSVSSDKTVIIMNNSPPVSRCVSVSSEKTVLLSNNNSPPLSPAPSNTSAVTEVLEFNQSGIKRPSSSLNDSKRKHSDNAQDGDGSCSKRPCPISSTSGQKSETKDSDVELCDLTQDSDSNTSFPDIANKFSGDSCDKICISSENENSGEANNETPSDAVCENVDGSILNGSDALDKISKSEALDKINTSNKEVTETSPGKSVEPYVSPVWDGFEEVNYDDLCFPEFAVALDSPHRVTVSSNSGAKISTPSASNGECLLPEHVNPEKYGSLNKERYQQECNTSDGGSSSDCEVANQNPTVLTKKPNTPTSSCFDALLDDSFNINDSILQQAESGMHGKLTQRSTKGTPVNRLLSSEPDGVTPLANYSAMKTPELKRELQKFGLKPTLGKRKGKIMLRHIYNELHPWVPTELESLQEKVTLSFSQPSNSSKSEKDILSSSQPNSRKLSFSQSDSVEKDTDCIEMKLRSLDSDSDSSSDDNRSMSMQEIQYLEGNENIIEPKGKASSQRVSKADLPKIVSDFIRNNDELHQKILEYEPIRIEQLQADLRTNGFRFKMEDLMAFLDEKCVTFRSAPSGPRVKRRKPRDAALVSKTTAEKTCNSSSLSD